MKHGVDQHRATPRGDGFDGAFCHPVLVVRIDAAEIGGEGVGLKNAVVTAVMLDADVKVLCITLKSVFCVQCVVGVEGHL
eukprot:7442902-Ditylum_brightwellii.AAC.1